MQMAYSGFWCSEMTCIVLLLCVEIRAAGSQSDYGVFSLVVSILLNLRPTPPHALFI